MKRIILFSVCVCFMLSIASVGFAQQVLMGEKFVQTRTLSAYYIPDSDDLVEQVEQTDDACVVKLDNWTGHYIDFWVDKIYKGRLSPWASNQVVVGSKWTEIYCRTLGQSYQWKAEGECNEEFQLKLEEY